MDKPTFALIMKESFAAYGKDLGTNSGKLIMSSWYKVFSDKDESGFRNALDRHIKSKETMPRINQILDLMKGHSTGERSEYHCPDCGVETDYLYRIGPSYPKPVCINCRELAHAADGGDMTWYKQMAQDHNIPVEDMRTHALAANMKNLPLGAYLESLPRNAKEFREYYRGKNITIGGEKISL